jgi:glutathione S-transferase
LVGAVPSEVLDFFGAGVGFGGEAVKEAIQGLKQDLEALSLILQHRPYLVTDEPTLADLAVAGLSMTIKFPAGDYLSIPQTLKGKGIPGLADNSAYEPFFAWRDRLYSDYRKSSSSASGGTGNPTVINIE